MKRDMDLIREILLEMENLPSYEMWQSASLLGYDEKDVVAHVQLAEDAGLLIASYCSGPTATVQRITNEGFDFLESSKQKTLWERAKGQVISNGLPMTIATLKAVLQKLISDAIANIH
jgi:Hypothetical protein (DUF2513)